MKAPACPKCGHVHVAGDARAVGMFTGTVIGYRTADGSVHDSREAAQEWLCSQRRRLPVSQPSAFAEDERPLFAVAEPAEPKPQAPFPAVSMETAAREKAWVDFLGHVRFSLMVWEIDAEVREGCEHVLTWMRRCSDDLATLTRGVAA